MFNERNSLINVFHKDYAILDEDIEFLKRVYHYQNQSTGNPEISHRIQLFSDFYATKKSIGSFYPTMVLTKTSAIFMKRFHRVTKTVDPQDTSNMFGSQEEQNNSQSKLSRLARSAFGQEKMSVFIESLNTQEIQELQQQSGDQVDMILRTSFYSIKAHDIFDGSFSSDQSLGWNRDYKQKQQARINLKKSNKQTEDQLNHLICQFDDYDIQQTLINYNRYSKENMNQTNFDSKNRQRGVFRGQQEYTQHRKQQASSNQNVYLSPLAFNKQQPKKKLNTKISIEPLDYGLKNPSSYSLQKKIQMSKPIKSVQQYRYDDYGQPQDVTSLKFNMQNDQRNHKVYSNYLRYARNQVNQAKKFSEEKTNNPSHYNYNLNSHQNAQSYQRRQSHQTLEMQKRQRIREKAAEMISLNYRPKGQRNYNRAKQN